MLKKILLVGALAPAILAETSAFNAGNISLETPYGLTENEKVMLENKKKVDNLSKGYTGVDFKTNKALERIEGIESIVDGLSNKTHNFEGKLLEYEKFSNENNENINKELLAIKKELRNHQISINQIKKALAELTDLVENIANNKNNNQAEQSIKTSVDTNDTPANKLKKAIAFYDAKDYDKATQIFEELVSLKHRPAQCNFYLGQISYSKKDYNNAIYYYKTSSDLYASQGVKAPNMPTILLNTANSLKAINEIDKANNFYLALKQQFPNSKEAKSIK